MEVVARAILESNSVLFRDLARNTYLTRGTEFSRRQIMKEEVVKIFCHEKFIDTFDDQYLTNFEKQRKHFLNLLDNNKHELEQHQIGLEFLLFVCKFTRKIIADFFLGLSTNSCNDMWDLNAILRACQAGEDEIYNFLLDGVNASEINRLHLLHRYVGSRKSRESIVRRFLELGANVNWLGQCNSSNLDCAIEFTLDGLSSDKMKIVKLLLDNGADPDLGAQCALDKAAGCGYQEIVELLLKHGANINGRPGASPMVSAAFRGKIKVVELLLDNGAERNDRALYQAIKNIRLNKDSKTKTVKFLLERGFDVDFATARDTVLCRAIQQNTRFSEGHAHSDGTIVQLLLDYGANVNRRANSSTLYPLHTAVEHGEIELVQLLLDHGADINMECNGETALRMSIRKKHFLQSKILIKHILVMKSRGLLVSRVNMDAALAKSQLARHYKICEKELETLRAEKFDDSTLCYYDILTINDNCRLASLATNENIVRAIKTDGFEKKFFIYGGMIVEKFERGLAKRKDFELLKRFIDYLGMRDNDQLPQLPFTVVAKLVNYLNNGDFAALWNL